MADAAGGGGTGPNHWRLVRDEPGKATPGPIHDESGFRKRPCLLPPVGEVRVDAFRRATDEPDAAVVPSPGNRR